jgi:hypothetical protein
MGYNGVYLWRQSCLNNGDLNRFFSVEKPQLSAMERYCFPKEKRYLVVGGKQYLLIRGML